MITSAFALWIFVYLCLCSYEWVYRSCKTRQPTGSKLCTTIRTYSTNYNDWEGSGNRISFPEGNEIIKFVNGDKE